MGAFFGFNPGTSNNAPPPVPIRCSVGTNTPSSGKGAAMPGFPIIGPSANSPVFGSTNAGGLSSGLPFTSGYGAGSGDAFYKQLSNAYGSGTAGLLWNILQGGLFNPQVASSFLNSMQPGVNRGVASLQQSFGAEGARFGSAASLGIGDYLSQVNLNEQQTLSQMFLTSQGEELNLLQNLLPTLHAEQASGGGMLQDILGGLEIAGGIAAAPFTGGLSLGITAAGVNTLNSGLSGGKGGGGTSLPNLPAIWNAPSSTTQPQTTPPFIAPGTTIDPTTIQDISAGGTLGGADPFSSGDGSATDPLFGNAAIDLMFGVGAH